MTSILKRCFALLLVLVLVFGMIPSIYAAEVTETTVPSETDNTETAASARTTEATDSTEQLLETEMAAEQTALSQVSVSSVSGADDAYGIMTVSSTTGNVTLFDQASPNYTTYLSSQISVTYKPNGTGSSVTAYIQNLGWHFARINGVSYPDDPIYCIEPYKNFAASTPGNYVDQGVTLEGSGTSSGSNVWYALPAERREAIALILLYSNQMWDDSYSVLTTPMDSNPNVPLRVATQFLIYEIVMGLRDASTFTLNTSNGYTSGDVFYNAGVSNVSGFASNYNAIAASVQSALKIPSFTSRSSSSAPTISLTGTTTSVTDTNGVLSNFSFTNGSGASFSKSGKAGTLQFMLMKPVLRKSTR